MYTNKHINTTQYKYMYIVRTTGNKHTHSYCDKHINKCTYIDIRVYDKRIWSVCICTCMIKSLSSIRTWLLGVWEQLLHCLVQL